MIYSFDELASAALALVTGRTLEVPWPGSPRISRRTDLGRMVHSELAHDSGWLHTENDMGFRCHHISNAAIARLRGSVVASLVKHIGNST